MNTVLRRIASLPLAALLVAAFPVLLSASEAAGEASRNPGTGLLLKFLNFAILIGILFYFLRKPISQGLADRQQNIRRELEEALQAKQAAEAKLLDMKQRVAGLEQEVQRIHQGFQAEGARQREHIADDARLAAQSIRQHAEAAGANEVKRALDELRSEVAQLSLQLAAQKLAKAYTPEDQKKAFRAMAQAIEESH